MVFFKGSFTKKDFDEMTMDELFHWRDIATTISKDMQRETDRSVGK